MEVIRGNIQDNTPAKIIDFDFINLNKEVLFVNNAKDIGMYYTEGRLVDFYN